MENGNTECNKLEEFGRGVMEQQMRMAIRDRTMSRDILK